MISRDKSKRPIAGYPSMLSGIALAVMCGVALLSFTANQIVQLVAGLDDIKDGTALEQAIGAIDKTLTNTNDLIVHFRRAPKGEPIDVEATINSAKESFNETFMTMGNPSLLIPKDVMEGGEGLVMVAFYNKSSGS